MRRPKGDYLRDYHVEYMPSLYPPPRLPQRVESKQHPEHDIYFMTVTILMEECAELNNGCSDCKNQIRCLQLQSALSERGSDRLVKDCEAHKFVSKFLKLLIGVK